MLASRQRLLPCLRTLFAAQPRSRSSNDDSPAKKETKTENQRGFLRCKKNFDAPLASKLPDVFISFTHSIRGKATSRVESTDSTTKRKAQLNLCSVGHFLGGESEIRTLEPCYRLHDFQSCALDQLGEFSICIQICFLMLNKYIISF